MMLDALEAIAHTFWLLVQIALGIMGALLLFLLVAAAISAAIRPRKEPQRKWVQAKDIDTTRATVMEN